MTTDTCYKRIFEMKTDLTQKILQKAISVVEHGIQDLSPAEQKAVYSALRDKLAGLSSTIKLPRVQSDDTKLAVSTLSKVARKLTTLLSAHGFSRGDGSREWIRPSAHGRRNGVQWEKNDVITIQKSRYSTNYTINLYSPKLSIPVRVGFLKNGTDAWYKVSDDIDAVMSDIETYALPWFENPKPAY